VPLTIYRDVVSFMRSAGYSVDDKVTDSLECRV